MASSVPLFSRRTSPLDDAETAAVQELRSALHAQKLAKRELERNEPRSAVRLNVLRDKASAAARRVATARRLLDEALAEDA